LKIEKIINKIYSIYQEKKIKNKEKLNNLVKELTTEESNVLEKEIDEKSEDIIKLFRKMDRNKLKQIINSYQFAKLVIKERKEQYKRMSR
jgi:vacuolar-type H+-ATPase subunit I/STV1